MDELLTAILADDGHEATAGWRCSGWPCGHADTQSTLLKATPVRIGHAGGSPTSLVEQKVHATSSVN
jgi:hypothetical protein